MNKFLTFYIRNSYKYRKINDYVNNERTMQTISRTSNSKIRQIGANGIFLLLIPIGTFCLGTWQVQRRKWKLGLIKELESQTSQPPIPFPENFHELEELEYRKVKIYGKFDHTKELFLGPRPLMERGDVSQIGGGLISTGQSGYNVITPFTLANHELTILVNRGWVPRRNKNSSQRLRGQISEPVELTGIVRKHEERAPFMPENHVNSNMFSYRDVKTMAKLTGSAPVYVDAVESLDGGPQGSQTRATLRNEHASYIMTWYSLSLATSFLWFRKFIMKKPLM